MRIKYKTTNGKAVSVDACLRKENSYKKNLLKHLKTICLDKRTNQEIKNNVLEMLNKLKDYWDIHDMDYGSVHKEIFSLFYLKTGKLTYTAAASRFFISEPTIKRYIIKYNKVAIKLTEREYPELLSL